MLREARRGQALVETMIALPVAILALIFLLWVGHRAIVQERVETMARYTQQVVQASNVYSLYSLGSLYDAATDAPRIDPNKLCSSIDPKILSSANFRVGNGATQLSSSLFGRTQQVTGITCAAGAVGVPGLSRDLMLTYGGTSFSVEVSPTFAGLSLFPNGSTPYLAARTLSDLTSPALQVLYRCYGDVRSAIHASLVAPAAGPDLDPTATSYAGSGAQAALNAPLPDTPPSNTSCGN